MNERSLRHGERGSAMVIALMTLVLLTMVGTLFLAQTKTETQIAGHDMRATQALFNAEAGYGEALARMSDTGDPDYIGEPSGTVTPGWGRYLVLANGNSDQDPDHNLAESDSLDNDGNGTVDESGEAYPEVATAQGGEPIDYPWVNVRYKLNATNQVILYGDHDDNLVTPPRFNLVHGYPVIIVTAEGERGSAARRVEVEAIKQPFELVQSALYSESDDFKFNGTQFKVSGQDWDPVTGNVVAGNPEVPGILTTGDPNNITNALSGQQTNNVEGLGGEPSATSTNVDMDLQAIADTYSPLAEYVVPAGTYDDVAWGSLDDYTVVHCTGDLHLSGNVSGGGILIVDGDMTVSGSFTWYGLCIVLGDVTFTGGGAGIHLYGSTLIQGSSNDQTVSGNADVLYSSEALNRLTALSPYMVANWRELN